VNVIREHGHDVGVVIGIKGKLCINQHR
jgi:hypothetical protein